MIERGVISVNLRERGVERKRGNYQPISRPLERRLQEAALLDDRIAGYSSTGGKRNRDHESNWRKESNQQKIAAYDA